MTQGRIITKKQEETKQLCHKRTLAPPMAMLSFSGWGQLTQEETILQHAPFAGLVEQASTLLLHRLVKLGVRGSTSAQGCESRSFSCRIWIL